MKFKLGRNAALALLLGVSGGALFLVAMVGFGSNSPAEHVATTTAFPGIQHPAAGNFKPTSATVSSCSPNDFLCFQQALGNLAYKSGPQVALTRVTQLLAPKGPLAVRADCHTITHYIGSATLARYHGNAAAAIGEASTLANLCGSGYYHGLIEYALEGVSSEKQLIGKITDLCADRTVLNSQFLVYQCLHGLGHGLMNVSGDDLPWALSMCTKLNDQWTQRSCSGGVFMQNFNLPSPLSPFKSTYVRKNDLLFPCDWKKVSAEYKYYCYLQVTEHILYATHYDWQRTAATCANAGREWVSLCFQSFGRDASGSSHYQPKVAYGYCTLTRSGLSDCIYGAARDFTNNDGNGIRAARFCADAEASLRGYCFYAIGTILTALGHDQAWLASTCRTLSSAYSGQCEGFLTTKDRAAIAEAQRQPAPKSNPSSASRVSASRVHQPIAPVVRQSCARPRVPNTLSVNGFSITYPSSWCVSTREDLARNLLHPVAFLDLQQPPASHKKHSLYASIVIRRARVPSGKPPENAIRSLKNSFRKEYKLTATKTVRTASGAVTTYSFASRGTSGGWNLIVAVVRAHDRRYIFQGLYDRGFDTAARQINASLTSFTST